LSICAAVSSGLLHGTTVDLIGRAGAQSDVPTGVSALVDESRSVGVQVDLLEEGDVTLVAPVIARTAHRVVQEALTNVRKHAPGADARVSVRYSADGVRVIVRNTAPTRALDSGLVTVGSGTGLTGLRQRIELIHGSLDAGPLPGSGEPGGFRVEATLPAFVATSASREAEA
jgi:signal transduction histidine kinase